MQRILKIFQQSSSGGDSLEEQLANSGAPEIAIYLRTSLRASFRRKPLTRAFRADLHEQIRIAATGFVWTMVFFSSIESSGPLLNGRTLKCTVKRCFNSIWRPKGGGSREPLEPPLPTGLNYHLHLSDTWTFHSCPVSLQLSDSLN